MTMDENQIVTQVKDAANAIDEALGTDIDVFAVGGVLAITDWFICATAKNARQVKSVIDKVEEKLTLDHKIKPLSIEGKTAGEWVLMDYGDFIVHIFIEEARQFYDLSGLWSDVARLEITLPAATPQGS